MPPSHVASAAKAWPSGSSRNAARLERLAADLAADGIRAAFRAADIRDAEALSAAVTSLADELGPVEVLEYSPVPAREFMKPVLETTVDDLRSNLEFSVLGALAAVTAVVGPMLESGSGTIHVGHTAVGGSIAPDGDHHPDEVADILWHHHIERGDFQVRLGID